MKARTPRRRKLAPAAPQISGVTPELETLIAIFDGLPRDDGWPAACAIRNSHGAGSTIYKHVDDVWTALGSGERRAAQAIIAFQARSPADLAAKIAFLGRGNCHNLLMNYQVAMPAILADAVRLVRAGPSDEPLLTLAQDAETAAEVHKVLWTRFQNARAGNESVPLGQSEKALVQEASEVSKKMGRLVVALFKRKASTVQGALAKLRIVALAYGNGSGSVDGHEELEAYQKGEISWLKSTIADLERLTGKGGAA